MTRRIRLSSRTRRAAAVVLGTLCLTASATPALAQPGGDHPWDRAAVPTIDPQVLNGDRPVDHPGVTIAAASHTDQQIMNGDRPSDRVPSVTVVRPAPTIVHTHVPVLAIVLAALALAVALAGGAELLAQRRALKARFG